MKYLCLFVVFLYFNNACIVSCTKSNSNMKSNSKVKVGNSRVTTIFQGWVNYHHEGSQTSLGDPKVFFQNNEFFNQRVLMSQKNQADALGLLNIPTKTSFFLVAYPGKIAFFSSRDKIESKAVDFLTISSIGIIPEDKPVLGAVKDIGKVDKYQCLQVKTEAPSSKGTNNELWTICLDNVEDKSKLMNALINQKIESQRVLGIYATADQLKDPNAPAASTAGVEEDEEKSSQDGVLQLLQDWSECTLKCGGGKSYQQYMCIPPKNGGAPCEGDLIRSKDCNTQPCPASKMIEGKISETAEKVAKPIVKIGPYSKRPNRYSKCIIKEGDAFRIEVDPKTESLGRIPSKILMNNRTFSIFEDDSYTKLVYSFQLEQTTFERDPEFCAFTLKNGDSKYTLRGFDQGCGTIDEDKFVKTWLKEFNLFKNDCKTGRESRLINEEAEEKLKEISSKKSELAYVALQEEKAAKMKDTFRSQQGVTAVKKVANTQKSAVKAIEKEALIERLILNEEQEKETLMLSNISKQISKEKEKDSNFNSQIKEKELDDVFKEEERKAEAEVEDAKKEVKEKVAYKRNDLTKKIESIRKLAKMKKSQMMGELKKAKMSLASKVMKAMKEGDAEICDKGKLKQADREKYCNVAFPDDYMLNVDCKEEENFCYTCCENEFGNMHMNKREECYDICDGIKKGKEAEPEPPKKDDDKIQFQWKSKS